MPASVTLNRPTHGPTDTIPAATYNAETVASASVPDATTATPGVVQLAGDGATTAGRVPQANDSRLSDARAWNGVLAAGLTQEEARDALAIPAGVALGTTAGTACEGNDSRLSNERGWNASFAGDATAKATARTNIGLGDSATKNVGTAAGTVAAGDHGHSAASVRGMPIDPRDYGAVSNDSAVDSCAGLQAAITAAIAAGRPLLISGTYYCKTFPASSTCYVSGAPAAIVTALVADGSLTMLGCGRTGRIVFGGSVSGQTWAVGLRVAAGDCVLDGVAFEFQKVGSTSGLANIHVDTGDSFEAAGCLFKNGFAHVQIYGERLLFRAIKNVFDARIDTEYGYGILCQDAPAVSNWQIRDNHFLGNNSLSIGADAILLNQDNNSGLLDEYSPDGVYNVAIEGNQIQDYVIGGGGAIGGINIAGPFNNLSVSGNQIKNCKVGISVEWTVVDAIIPRTTAFYNYRIAGNQILDAKYGIGISLGDEVADMSTLDTDKPHRMVLVEGNAVKIRPDPSDTDDCYGITSSFGWLKAVNNTLIFSTDVMLADSSKRGYGIYCQRHHQQVEHNVVVNFKYGIGFAGGVQATQHRRVHANELHHCATSYYFDEQTARMGQLMIDGNRHVGCGELVHFTNAPTVNRIYVTNEVIAGQMMIDQGWLGTAANFPPYGVVSSSAVVQVPDADLNSFYSPNFTKVGLLSGHRLRFGVYGPGDNAELVATSAGNAAEFFSDITGSAVSGSNVLTLAAAVPDTINSGIILTMTAAGIDRAIITYIDRINRRLKVSTAATATTASATISFPKADTFAVKGRGLGFQATAHASGTLTVANDSARWREITGSRTAYAEIKVNKIGVGAGDFFYFNFRNYTDGGGGEFFIVDGSDIIFSKTGTLNDLVMLIYNGTAWRYLVISKTAES